MTMPTVLARTLTSASSRRRRSFRRSPASRPGETGSAPLNSAPTPSTLATGRPFVIRPLLPLPSPRCLLRRRHRPPRPGSTPCTDWLPSTRSTAPWLPITAGLPQPPPPPPASSRSSLAARIRGSTLDSTSPRERRPLRTRSLFRTTFRTPSSTPRMRGSFRSGRGLGQDDRRERLGGLSKGLTWRVIGMSLAVAPARGMRSMVAAESA